MRTIIVIQHVEHRVSQNDKPYTISHLLLDDGEEAEGYGANFAVGDQVEVFLHFGKIKAQKKPNRTGQVGKRGPA